MWPTTSNTPKPDKRYRFNGVLIIPHVPGRGGDSAAESWGGTRGGGQEDGEGGQRGRGRKGRGRKRGRGRGAEGEDGVASRGGDAERGRGRGRWASSFEPSIPFSDFRSRVLECLEWLELGRFVFDGEC